MKKQKLTSKLELKKFQITKILNPQLVYGGLDNGPKTPNQGQEQGPTN